MAHFTLPDHIYTGPGALDQALPALTACGSKALIVTGPHVGASAICRDLVRKLQAAGLATALFDGVTGEPTDIMITAGLEAYRAQACDFLIGLGGGSPLDAAKAISAMSVLAGTMADCMGHPIEGDLPPVAAIPTTAGTGSEATKFTIITDTATEVKMLLAGESLLPRVAVVDPALSADMPRSLTVATGLDALTHAVEAYTSRKAQPLTDALALSAAAKIMQALPAVLMDPHNEDARADMAMAALEAGICINNSSVTIVHGMSRPIGALFHVPHDLSNAMLLTACMAFAVPGAPDRFADLGRACGAASREDDDGAAAQAFIRALDKLCAICRVPSLAAYGIPRAAFAAAVDKMAADAMASGSPGNTRRAVTAADCAGLYRQIYGL
jgi:alcohol dehydrogenase class IV